jgi:hypothetical protein
MRTAFLALAGVGAVALTGSAHSTTSAPTKVVSNVSRATGSGQFVPATLPGGYKVIAHHTNRRWQAAGTIETTTYGAATKREVLDGHLGGLGSIFTVSVFRGGAPVQTPPHATPQQLRGHHGWAFTDHGSTYLGWTERDGLSIQVVAQNGFSVAALTDIATNLVEQS